MTKRRRAPDSRGPSLVRVIRSGLSRRLISVRKELCAPGTIGGVFEGLDRKLQRRAALRAMTMQAVRVPRKDTCVVQAELAEVQPLPLRPVPGSPYLAEEPPQVLDLFASQEVPVRLEPGTQPVHRALYRTLTGDLVHARTKGLLGGCLTDRIHLVTPFTSAFVHMGFDALDGVPANVKKPVGVLAALRKTPGRESDRPQTDLWDSLETEWPGNAPPPLLVAAAHEAGHHGLGLYPQQDDLGIKA